MLVRDYIDRDYNREFQQTGQPEPLVRLDTVASHSCPCSQSHQTFFPELVVMSSGPNDPFFFGCYSRTNTAISDTLGFMTHPIARPS